MTDEIQPPTAEDLARDAAADLEESERIRDIQDRVNTIQRELESDPYLTQAAGDFYLFGCTALPAWIRRAVAAEEAVRQLAPADWRTCPSCGILWPHPSVTSEMSCRDCHSAEQRQRAERAEAEVAYLRRQMRKAQEQGYAI